MNPKRLKWIIFVACFVAALSVAFWLRSSRPVTISAESPPPSARHTITRELAAEIAQLEAKEQKMNETVWAKEILAEDYGRVFESLWNALNRATNKLDVAASFPVGEIVLPKLAPPQHLANDIQLWQPSDRGPASSAEQWRGLVADAQKRGWQLAQTEFRHNRFETDRAGQPAESHFYFSAHLTNQLRPERAVVDGDLKVIWAAKQTTDDLQPVKTIDASGLAIKTRSGEPPFLLIHSELIEPPRNSSFIDPLIVYDLDGDGFSEIILAAKNLVYRRRARDRYQPEVLCRHEPGLISTALIADFDGDGTADFLCARLDGLVLFNGSRRGSFDEPGRVVWTAPEDLQRPMVLTCGDMDHDGDLDVFLAQYRVPYDDGNMPVPDHDANDGYPAYLLRNDGHGNFSDATASAGLEKKRRRRSYASSFVDLNEDGHPDLVVISDFAGVDLYRNDGHGHFIDVTRQWVAQSKAFGMAHALADFNADGRLDLFMVGMTSPTANRLNHLGLWRSETLLEQPLRGQMTFGNRLYLASHAGGFEQTSLGDSIARSGWSWGCSAFDFDNDGFSDVYIANGMETSGSVRDYESEYWLHDRYVGTSTGNSAAYFYLKGKVTRMRGRGESYGGYERNRLYLNQGAKSFLETGHLMGVALEQDSRGVVDDDLDGDGRVDLLVTGFETWPGTKQTLRIYQNNLEQRGNWIGFRFREEGAGKSPVDAQVKLRHAGGTLVRALVTGDSYRSQHANTVHFGLGKTTRVESVEIRWANGETLTLQDPEVNHYHSVKAPGKVAPLP